MYPSFNSMRGRRLIAFTPENFPLYRIIQDMKLPGAEVVKQDFEAARDGGDAQKYSFAMGLYTVAAAPGLSQKIPAMTSAVLSGAQKQAYDIFEELAARDHAQAALMTSYMKAAGQGTPQDLQGAKTWLDRAEDLGGKNDFTQKLRKQITTVYLVVPPRKAATP